MQNDTEKELPIFTQWMKFQIWLLNVTDLFPKKARFTFANRLQNISLEITEILVEARYTKNKIILLKKGNLNLEKMRILLRVCYESKFISHDAYKDAMYSIYEVGSQFGGWIKQQEVKL